MSDQPNMPKVIPSVWIGLVAASLAVAASFGLELSPAQQTAIIGFASALAAAIPAIDVWLRRARLAYLTDLERSSKENG